MRIIIASEIFPPDPGGPATYVTRIVPELLKLGNEVFTKTLELYIICCFYYFDDHTSN